MILRAAADYKPHKHLDWRCRVSREIAFILLQQEYDYRAGAEIRVQHRVVRVLALPAPLPAYRQGGSW
jgi:hypothetical protein